MSVKIFEQRLASLRRYRERHGAGEVQLRIDACLHRWVKYMRKRRDVLSPEQVAQLDDAGFEWGGADADWDAMVDELKRTHLSAATTGDTPAYGAPLQRWVSRQRWLYCRGALSSQRVAELEAAGLVLDAWRVHFRELQCFVERFGHCRPPSTTQLAVWVRKQKQLARSGELLPERLTQLQALGLEYGRARLTDDDRVRQLAVYYQRHGHFNVPGKTDDGLGVWLAKQRRRKYQGTIDPQLQARMEGIGFAWDLTTPTAPTPTIG